MLKNSTIDFLNIVMKYPLEWLKIYTIPPGTDSFLRKNDSVKISGKSSRTPALFDV